MFGVDVPIPGPTICRILPQAVDFLKNFSFHFITLEAEVDYRI